MKRIKILKKGSTKNNELGITLIALVVTIIVLLLLAGISITMLTENNGILNRTVQAKEATRGGEVQETVNLAAISNIGVDYTGGTKKTRADVINELHTQKNLTDEEVSLLTDEDNPIDVITIGGITIDFSVLGSNAYFYIYHSSNCMVERIPLTSEYDITTKIDTRNYRYAGYFNTYGGSMADVKLLTYINNIAIDETGEKYDATNLKTQEGERFWKRENAYTNNGKTMHPEKDMVYYLKEVPNAYLKVKQYCGADNNNRLGKLLFVTAIDDSCYKKTSYFLSENEIQARTVSRVVDNGESIISIEDIEGVSRGFLSVVEFLGENNGFITANWQYTIMPCWTTLDGVDVYGESREFNTGCDENGYCTLDTIEEIQS